MKLSSLIDDYQTCASRLFAAIEAEDMATIRELDIRMSWLRDAIREFPTATPSEKRRQIVFFLDLLSNATDQDSDVPPLADLRRVIDRHIAELPEGPAPARRGETARLGAMLARNDAWNEDALAMIEKSNLRISVIGRDMRYRYTSPANSRFHGIPSDDFEGMHLFDIIGRKRFEKRARAYMERCLAGEDLSYCYYLDTEKHGRLLLECRLLAQYGPDSREPTGVIIIMRDLTRASPDPILSAEENRV